MRTLISLLTIILLLYTIRGLYMLFPAIGVPGITSILIPTASVFILSIAGLFYWYKRNKIGVRLLLGAWVISVVFSITISWNSTFIPIQTLIGVPTIVMLTYTMWKDYTNETNT